MKQRTEKEFRSLTALPEYMQILDERRSSDNQSPAGKRQLDFERSQLQIKRSMAKRNDSIMAVRKSMAAVDDFYRTYCRESGLPIDDAEWERFQAVKI